ncbi:hypothetical protein Dda_1898 [Drechslerella dactyloides]|uniref:Uncharacterized protein n=1 Tax=Drechslerella dactyloides TaxID=74499 RepID=A0AAD6NMJ5_DREDA|nr:hypothetical protein Dda_1898 [Drechslerella dactyloides]
MPKEKRGAKTTTRTGKKKKGKSAVPLQLPRRLSRSVSLESGPLGRLFQTLARHVRTLSPAYVP